MAADFELYQVQCRIRSGMAAAVGILRASREVPLVTAAFPLVRTAAIACNAAYVLRYDTVPVAMTRIAEMQARMRVCDLINAAVVVVADNFRPRLSIMSSFSIWWRNEDVKHHLPAELVARGVSTRSLYWKRVIIEVKVAVSEKEFIEFQQQCSDYEKHMGLPPGAIVSVRRASCEVKAWAGIVTAR